MIDLMIHDISYIDRMTYWEMRNWLANARKLTGFPSKNYTICKADTLRKYVRFYWKMVTEEQVKKNNELIESLKFSVQSFYNLKALNEVLKIEIHDNRKAEGIAC